MNIVLTHFIYIGWIKNISTSMLAFNIIQSFLLLNHQILLWTLNKRGFDPKVLLFFQNYLVSRRAKYLWNSFSSPFFNIDIGVGQGSALFLILSALYLAPILHISEKRIKILISILLFVNDGLFISWNKSLVVLNVNLVCSYNVISLLFGKFELTILQVATSVSHIHCHDRLIIKTLHHAVKVMTTKTELFTIRYSINQAIHLPNIKKIFVVMDFIYTARRIFNSLSSHLY